MENNLLWILLHVHASEKQSVPSWTAFYILVCNDHEVAKDNVGYLPTINAPVTNMSTVYQVLCLRDVIIESGVIAQGSVSDVLEGRTYNRAIRFHKLIFEALNTLAWMVFNSWTDEHHKEKKPLDEFFKGKLFTTWPIQPHQGKYG